LYLNVSTRDNYFIDKRPNVDIILIIDNSGSMGGKKIKLVKETIAFLLDELKENDKFGLIVFNQVSEILIPFMKMTSDNKKEAKKIVK